MDADKSEADVRVMVVAVEAGDTEVLRHILNAEHKGVVYESDPDAALTAFVRHQPEVLMMAFSDISAAERFYLGLFRTEDNAAGKIRHQAVVLCSSKETDTAYALCKKRVFDDYVAFRPLHDPNQLKMSVRQALVRNQLRSSAAEAAPALMITRAELGKMGSFVSSAVEAARGLDREVSSASTQLSLQMDKELEALQQLIVQREFDGAIKLVDKSQVGQHLNAVKERVQELRNQAPDSAALSRWLDGFEQDARNQLNKIDSQVQSTQTQTILVVEDDKFIQRIYSQILGKAGYQVFVAEDGYAALRHLHQQLPDLILMDIMLPDINGIETTRRIKAEPRFRDTPVIIASGRAERNMVQSGIAAGACDFIAKPVNAKILLEKLQKYLGR